MDTITYPCWDKRWSVLVKGATSVQHRHWVSSYGSYMISRGAMKELGIIGVKSSGSQTNDKHSVQRNTLNINKALNKSLMF